MNLPIFPLTPNSDPRTERFNPQLAGEQLELCNILFTQVADGSICDTILMNGDLVCDMTFSSETIEHKE